MVTSLLLVLLCHAAGPLPAQPQDLVTVVADEYVVYKGKSNSIHIWIEVNEGYHIQANRTKDPALIPTTLEISGDKKIAVSGVEFPPAKNFTLEGTQDALEVYDGKFPVTLFLRPGRHAPDGEYILRARLRYQACDSRTCLFPRVVEFTIPITVKVKEG